MPEWKQCFLTHKNFNSACHAFPHWQYITTLHVDQPFFDYTSGIQPCEMLGPEKTEEEIAAEDEALICMFSDGQSS